MNIKERMGDFVTRFDPHFHDSIDTMLSEQQQFHNNSVSLDNELRTIVHNYANNGKRIRPFIIEYIADRSINNADVLNTVLSVELFHLMALIHDDIIDQSTLRRGVPTVHTAVSSLNNDDKLLGESIAMLLGDAFLVESLRYAQQVNAEIFGEISTILQRTVRGQYLDVLGMNTSLEGTEENIIYDREYLKTAWYTFAGPAKLGLLLQEHKLSDKDIDTIILVYIELGLLFQIRDDIIDCDPNRSDKSPFEDIREGKTTWVTLYIKEHYPHYHQQIIAAQKQHKYDAITDIFSDIDLHTPYDKEYERCASLVTTLKDIDTSVYEKTVSILELLKLPS